MSRDDKRAFLRANGWVRHDLGNQELWMPITWVGIQPMPISLVAAYKRVKKLKGVPSS